MNPGNYVIYDKTGNFEDAEAFCVSEGSHLASIGSDSDNAMIVKGAKTKTTSFAARSRRTHSNGLKPTTMSRIVSSAVYETACDDMRQGGIDWYKKSRCTRSTCPPDVTRKAKNAVTAISAEAEELLGNVFGSATFAMDHAKRKTLKKSDMDLVSKIARNTGPFHAFFG